MLIILNESFILTLKVNRDFTIPSTFQVKVLIVLINFKNYFLPYSELLIIIIISIYFFKVLIFHFFEF